MTIHRKRLISITLVTLLQAGIRQAPADLVPANWSTNAIGNWSNPTLWSTNPIVPNNTADDQFAVTIASGKVTVDLPVTIDSLQGTGGEILNGTLTIQNQLTLDGIQLKNAVVNLPANSTTNIAAGGFSLNSGELNSHGVINWTGATVDSSVVALFNNFGQFNVSGNGVWTDSTRETTFSSDDQSYVANWGTLHKTGPGVVTFVPDLRFQQYGLIDIDEGTLLIHQMYNNIGGVWDIAAGAVFQTQFFGMETSTVHGEGDLLVVDGVINARNGDNQVARANLQNSAIWVGEGSTLTVQDDLQLTGQGMRTRANYQTTVPQSGKLIVEGEARLEGTLQFSTNLVSGNPPQPGDQFNIIEAESIPTRFDRYTALLLPSLSTPDVKQFFRPVYTETELTMVFTVATLGDANLDDTVDFADFTIFQANFLAGNVWTLGDFNFDNAVDLLDRDLLYAHLSPDVTQSQRDFILAFVPEPSLAAGLFGLMLLAGRRVGRRRV